VAYEDGDHILSVTVYEFWGGEPCYDEERIFFTGFVKWDGCSNWDMGLHFCSKKQAVELGTLLGRLYGLAARMIPHWDGD
jgi:hypothetical protein